jgi:hypothetical protein
VACNDIKVGDKVAVFSDDDIIYIDHPNSYDEVVGVPMKDIPTLIVVLQQLYDNYQLENRSKSGV